MIRELVALLLAAGRTSLFDFFCMQGRGYLKLTHNSSTHSMIDGFGIWLLKLKGRVYKASV